MDNKIEIKEKKLCSKTLCGDCFWLDKSQPTKDGVFLV